MTTITTTVVLATTPIKINSIIATEIPIVTLRPNVPLSMSAVFSVVSLDVGGVVVGGKEGRMYITSVSKSKKSDNLDY